MTGFCKDIVFIGKCKSTDFIEALPDKLTLRKDIPAYLMKSFSEYKTDTIFYEVSINKYQHSREALQFLQEPVTEIKDLDELYQALKKAVYENWDVSKIHIIGHSSGYDSRILSNIIKELTLEYGQQWAGKIYFVEVLGEGEQFKNIMQKQGLDGLIYKENYQPSLYHHYSFDFETFWQKFNGLSAFPINQWYDAYKYFNEQGILPSNDIQGITGYGANESMEIALKKIGFANYYEWHHYLQLQYFKEWGGDWIYPYWDWDVQKVIRGCIMWKDKTRLAKYLADQITPHLKGIPQISIKQLKKMGYRTLDKSIIQYMIKKYDKSWYGKQVPIKIMNDQIDYFPWFYQFNIASLCEHLLEQGYKIAI